ncbi:MAG: glutamate-5-semialdehyde dehydrogenase [Propionibacteriaceae bacterium]|jgi:glutamate-5-semialdehyde dehydrogenase|nr:glutamate-5-semialdehyde dehydrogenase [Propionibacteriaceae bacterium]
MNFIDQAQAAKAASVELALLNRAQKDAALAAMGEALHEAEADILAANELDLRAARSNGITEALIDRLALSPQRVDQIIRALLRLGDLPDQGGDVARGWTMANGVRVRQVRVPLGVIGIIYESRPNVTVDAAGICVKAGNAALLRGSSTAVNSNRAIVAALRQGLANAGLPVAAVQLVEGDRAVTAELMHARGLVDVLIPRGGAGLIKAVVEESSVPVIATGAGNCHLYVDQSADLEMALAILVNAKTQRPGVCNAVETLLVHERVGAALLPRVAETMALAGVVLHVTPAANEFCAGAANVVPAAPDEFAAEYLSLDLAVDVVENIDAAIAHIGRYSSGHSETIIAQDRSATDHFTAAVDAAAVLVNASSRFVDGGEFGFGAEIGISTQKLHARGPMGLLEMTSTKYIVEGDGQTRC